MAVPGHEVDQFRQFIDKLQRDDQRPEALNNIKNILTVKTVETSNMIRDVGLSKIFRCLSVNDAKQVGLTCEVLKLCFEKFNVGDVIRNYTGYFMYLLRHEKECVRQIAIDEVYKTITADEQLLTSQKYVDVFVAVGQLVTDLDTAIANKAILITSHLPQEAYPKVLEEMKIALEYDTSSKCNAFEVIINISSRSQELLNLSVDNGYIEYMLSELRSTDILYQMNILELLSRLAVTHHGVRHLVECGALQNICELVSNLRTNPLANILIPGYMRFFGSIARIYPREVFEKYPVLLDSLLTAFDSGDQSVLPIALDTLGFVGATIEGKLSLMALGSTFTTAVAKVGEYIKSGNSDIKIRALYCLASLIDYENDPNSTKAGPLDHRVTLMSREWFRSISTRPDSMVTLCEACKNPFPDIQLAAFKLLNAVCQHNWGNDLVDKCPGLVEYLLDRSVDQTKDLKEAKYEVIKKMARSSVFDPNTILRFTAYVDQGPFYSETVLAVAMEEGD